MYPRKLSTLSEELLGIEIQQQNSSSSSASTSTSSSIEGTKSSSSSKENNDGNKGKSVIQNESAVGHSSVEDAAAALRLYWHNHIQWERSLGYPLDKTQQQQFISRCWPPLKIYLDGSDKVEEIGPSLSEGQNKW